MFPNKIPDSPNALIDDGHKPWFLITAKAYRIIYIIYSLEVGIALLWLPWKGIWENNLLLYLFPQIGPVVTNPFFKGAILGLGIDNILIGIYETIRLKSSSKKADFR
jgi:hypothetical protein